MNNSDWINEIDSIIRDNVDSVGRIFSELKAQTVSVPFNSSNMIDQLDASEKLTKEMCLSFIGQLLMWIRKEFNIPRHFDLADKSNHLATLEESLNLD